MYVKMQMKFTTQRKGTGTKVWVHVNADALTVSAGLGPDPGSPSGLLVSASLGPGGAEFNYSRLYHRLGGGAAPASFSQHVLYQPDDCWRPAVAHMLRVWPAWFRPDPQVAIAQLEGAPPQQQEGERSSSGSVAVVFASEVSSRTFGWDHVGSDSDVTALFCHPLSRYLSIRPPATAMRLSTKGGSGDEGCGGSCQDVDVRGMEVRHAFELLVASNPSLLEAFCSPIVYRQVPHGEGGGELELCRPRAIRTAIGEHYDRAALVQSWTNHAKYNYGAYIKRRQGGEQALKEPRNKYLHCIRPLLCI